MTPWPARAAIVILALLSFFQFPGHTWLQQDSQIYTPILEHLRDPSVLAKDMLVERPHVSFTVYDEVALAFTFMVESMARGEASIAVPIAQMGFVATALLGFLFLGERFTARKGFGIAVALAALASLAHG